MINEKVRVLILASASPDVEAGGAALASLFRARGIEVVERKASATLIPNIAPFDLLIFGARPDEDLAGGDYRELNRSCRGVSFAGRWAALYSPADGPVFGALEKMLADTEIRFIDAPLVLGAGADRSAGASAWCEHALRAVAGQT
jgi:hypothetical protein